MARISISIPDDLYRDVLARRGTRHEVDVSKLASEAIREYLRYGPEADEEMRELAREMETDPEYQALLADWDSTTGDGIEPLDEAEEEWVNWLKAGRPADWVWQHPGDQPPRPDRETSDAAG
jgi:hypothetical protein